MVRVIDYTRCIVVAMAMLVAECAMASTVSPGIFGTVYLDSNDNGFIDPGEMLPGVTMSLYRDDGDGSFSPADQLIGSPVITDATGAYAFPDLEDAGYFVEQAAIPGYSSMVSPLTQPGAADVLIDDFVTGMSLVGDPIQLNDTQSVMNSPEGPSLSALRQVDVSLVSGVGLASVMVNPFGLDSRLVYSTSAGVTGRVLVTWDFSAFDPPGNELPSTAPIDLTENGERTGLMLQVGVDQAGSDDSMTVRLVGEDPSEVSIATLDVPVTNGFDTNFVFVPFSDFEGSADPSAILSVELELGDGSPSVDASIDTFGVLGPKLLDFSVGSNPVPEPAAMGMVGIAVLGTLLLFRRQMC